MQTQCYERYFINLKNQAVIQPPPIFCVTVQGVNDKYVGIIIFLAHYLFII